MNYTYYYFGAYLEIAVKKSNVNRKIKGCPNGHDTDGQFCNICGQKLLEKTLVVEEYPRMYDLLSLDFEDDLRVITPPKLNGSGVILAIGNFGGNGEWLHFRSNDWDIETKSFPTEAEIRAMKTELETNYKAVIEFLRPLVENIEIKAGYVLNTEY